jgi:hypothetical protein
MLINVKGEEEGLEDVNNFSVSLLYLLLSCLQSYQSALPKSVVLSEV